MKSNQSNVVSSYHQWYEFISYLFLVFFFFFSFIPPSIMSSILHPLDHKSSLLICCFFIHKMLFSFVPTSTSLHTMFTMFNQSATIFIHGQRGFGLILNPTTKIFISVSLIVQLNKILVGIHVIINLTCFFFLYAYFHVKANDVKIFQFLLV